MAETLAPEQQERKEVTIKFGKGLVKPFTSKSGRAMVRISIPNQDSSDKLPWETFVVSAKQVHDNNYGVGVWMKLPKDGKVTLARPVPTGKDDAGKTVWGRESRQVPDTELKAMLEAYKDKNRGSVLSDLAEKKEAAAQQPRESKPVAHAKEASL